MKNLILLTIVCTAALIASFSFKPAKKVFKEPIPPSGYTGAPTQSRTCVNCHGDFSLNTAGGSVYTTGLPNGSYIPGHVYNFSLTITHGSTMQMWGFAIKAVITGTSGTALGTFSTSNPNATVASGELKDNNAVSFTGSSYTYNNLTWTAPASGGSLVSFYMTGMACDADGSEAGDYVYSNTQLSIPVPVTMGEVTGKLTEKNAFIEWSTYSETGSGHFELERSVDAINYNLIDNVPAAGNSNSRRVYNYTDRNIPINEQVLYYRLKLVDQDGKATYSKTIVLKKILNGTYIENVYPATVNENGTIDLKIVSDLVQKADVAIFASNGIIVSRQSMQLSIGRNEIRIPNIHSTGTGIYILKMQAGNSIDTRKLLIK